MLYDHDFFVELEVKVTVINKISEKTDDEYQLQVETHKVWIIELQEKI